jgi:hypothetical protein
VIQNEDFLFRDRIDVSSSIAEQNRDWPFSARTNCAGPVCSTAKTTQKRIVHDGRIILDKSTLRATTLNPNTL